MEITNRRPERAPGGVEGGQFDHQYMEELRRGVPATEAHFANHFSALLNRMLRRRLRCPALIEDVRQETLTRVLVSIRRGQVQKPERLALFVLGVCRRVVCESLRDQRVMVYGRFETDNLVDEAADPDTLVSNHQRTQYIRDVLARLSPRDREILRLVYIDGVTRSDISSSLGVGDDSFRLLLHRARLRFRNAARDVRVSDALRELVPAAPVAPPA